MRDLGIWKLADQARGFLGAQRSGAHSVEDLEQLRAIHVTRLPRFRLAVQLRATCLHDQGRILTDMTSRSVGMLVVLGACGGGSGGCEHGESGLELLGVGGARVSGTIAVSGQSAESSLTLRGVDTLLVSISQSCIHWEIDGTDRFFDQGTCP